MARAAVKMPDAFLERISKLNNRFDEIVPRVLEKGAEPVIQKAKTNLAARIGQGTKESSQSTGELLASLETTRPTQNANGDWNLRVGVPTTKDSKGVSNALKAAVLEYGKSGQPPRPWLKPTKSATRKACVEAMEKALEKEIEKL
ncbi:HK97-gp10 family putative phage morphogenesis protein [Robertmurraya andreesenii]|uniref:HK97 gp10 family phage protein n=1 Tax=Anoxybacillus andreesenii TaxID=1325932 RepID=A0ABT9UZN6_9BACL|nr:HK97-gp10 family putative phage morphogenesis protein [Robertmurraya andreesenii]MDQ0154154.1 HK97 gp10 family phage protein [Robertmurraya andreesenii]